MPDSGQIERVTLWRLKSGGGWHEAVGGDIEAVANSAVEVRTFIPEESVERLAGELEARANQTIVDSAGLGPAEEDRAGCEALAYRESAHLLRDSVQSTSLTRGERDA